MSGTCSYGERCKFLHGTNHENSESRNERQLANGRVPLSVCNFCKKKGHTENVCRTKARNLQNPPMALLADANASPASLDDVSMSPAEGPFVLMFTSDEKVAPPICGTSPPFQIDATQPILVGSGHKNAQIQASGGGSLATSFVPGSDPCLMENFWPKVEFPANTPKIDFSGPNTVEDAPILAKKSKKGGAPVPNNNFQPLFSPSEVSLGCGSGPNSRGWVLDSGATSCATYSCADCVDVRPCNVSVTSAGCVFIVEQIGMAIIYVLTDLGGCHS
jgi:hypothetical protein